MITLVVAAVLCYMAGWPVYVALIRYRVIDRPNERSSHSRTTARGGGVAIILAVLLVAVFGRHDGGASAVLAVLLGATIVLAVVSFVDDLRSIPASIRFGCHGLAALSVLAVLEWPSLRLGLTSECAVELPVALGMGLAFLWIAGYTNAFNFMDGINGIAAGQAVVTGIGTALLGGLVLEDFHSAPVRLSLVVAGAAAGFLPHNFPNARMFMGDVGSAPLGFLLAALAVWLAKIAGWWLVVPMALLHANFVLDTGITLVRRIFRGERWYKAHREHFYQRLVRAGKGHTLVTTLEMGLQCVVLGLLTLYIHVGASFRLILVVAVMVIWLSFFAWAEICFTRFMAEQGQAASVKFPTAP